jgi:hypothetical protein
MSLVALRAPTKGGSGVGPTAAFSTRVPTCPSLMSCAGLPNVIFAENNTNARTFSEDAFTGDVSAGSSYTLDNGSLDTLGRIRHSSSTAPGEGRLVDGRRGLQYGSGHLERSGRLTIREAAPTLLFQRGSGHGEARAPHDASHRRHGRGDLPEGGGFGIGRSTGTMRPWGNRVSGSILERRVRIPVVTAVGPGRSHSGSGCHPPS